MLGVQAPPSAPPSIEMIGRSTPASFPAAPVAPTVPAPPPLVPAVARAAAPPPFPVLAPGVTPAHPAATARATDQRTRAAFWEGKRTGAIDRLLVTVRYPNGVRRAGPRLSPG